MINFEIDLNTIPATYGIYVWKNINDQIIYIGKANNIRKRIVQYLNGSINSYKTSDMLANSYSLSYIVCANEREALILEQEMIKMHRPYYNILLLDDKKYPFIQVELKKNKLEIKTTFTFKEDKKTFSFGPIPVGFGPKTIKDFLIREYLYENGLPIENNDEQFWLNKFNSAKKIINSNQTQLIKRLQHQMNEASENEQYEIATELRDILNYLKKLNSTKQTINLNNNENIDVIHFYQHDEFLLITIHHYVNGSFYLQEEFIKEIKINKEDLVLQFLNFIYSNRNKVKKIITNEIIRSEDVISSPKIINPQKGANNDLLNNAMKNNTLNIEKKIIEYKQKDLSIAKVKHFIESITNQEINNFIMIDNSTNFNQEIVSAIIYYKNFYPFRPNYRKYNHLKHELSKLGDVSYMKLGIKKYFQNQSNEVPDLIIVDGGVQQINEIKKTLIEINYQIPVIGLVKNDNHKTSHLLDQNNKKINFVDKDIFNYFSKIQIEVDRFAKNYLHKKSLNNSLEGFLLTISGIGPSTEKKLLEHFKTYSNIFNATEQQLCSIVSKRIAKKIIEKTRKIE